MATFKWDCGHDHKSGDEIEIVFQDKKACIQVCADCIKKDFDEEDLEEILKKEYGWEECPQCGTLYPEDDIKLVILSPTVTNTLHDNCEPEDSEEMCPQCRGDE